MSHNRMTCRTLKSVLLLGALAGLLGGCFHPENPEESPSEGPGGGPSESRLTLTGTVSSAVGATVDGDVNDPNASVAVNNTPAQAQPIPNPVTVGGYANVARAGDAGPLFLSGDRSDFYRVSLAAGQTITLNIADFDVGDLDLYLYYDDGTIDIANPDFGSTGTGKTESLTVADAGDYLIEVWAYSGYANYALVVGQGAAAANGSQADRLVLSDDFVPGDVVVRFKDTVQALGAKPSAMARAASLGLQARAGASDRAMLLALGDLQDRQASFRALGITSAQKGSQARRFQTADSEKQLKLDTLQVIKALRQRDDVLYAEPNYIRRAQQVPTDQHYHLQWHYPLINLPAAWDVSTGDASVIVAVIDTGVLLNHPDLAGQFSADGGYDFIRRNDVSRDGESGIDDDPDDPGDSGPVAGGSSFHGTHVAGTIAAATSFGGGGRGVAGVAPGVKIMPLRVLGKGGGTNYDIAQAVRYAAGLPNDAGRIPARPADVINLSLGGGGYSQLAQDLYTEVRNRGVVIVAAAGNESTSSPSYPAAYAGVISVSAVDIRKQLAPYSNFGATIDVAAPGGKTSRPDVNGDGYVDGVLSTVGDDSAGGSPDYVYKFYQGTSMATPHMAGVVALMKSVYSELTPDDVDNLLIGGNITEDLGASGRDDQFGHGLIDAFKAVNEARVLRDGGVIADNPLLNVTPAALNFGGNLTRLSLSVVNGGSGALPIDTISDDADWLTISPDSVDAAGLGSYAITVDRTNLSSGTYTATITVTPADATLPAVTVQVIQQVGGPSLTAGAGFHYVLLVDTETGDVSRSQWGGAGQDGQYRFRLDNVPFAPGQRYVIFAGTDHDNDGYVCDAGEACGIYLSRDRIQTIGASDSLSGLDFVSGFNIGLQGQAASVLPARGIAIPRRQFKQVPQ